MKGADSSKIYEFMGTYIEYEFEAWKKAVRKLSDCDEENVSSSDTKTELFALKL